MTAKLSGGTEAAGVLAYQDSVDPTQFHYLPANAHCILGATLADFGVKYWGIGKPFRRLKENGSIDSVVGAVLSGRAVIDISDDQRRQITEAIARAYGVPDPKLLPMMLHDVTVQPVIGQKTLGLGFSADAEFPSVVQLGASFSFLVGTGDSLFATFVGAQDNATQMVPDPSFGINIQGNAEFQGDPWQVRITADLGQVWSYTRRRFGGGVGYGWWRISLADYEQVITEMQRDQVITLEFIEGSYNTEEFGRQIFEMGKELFQAVNEAAAAQEGFFKFEPNPSPSPSERPGSGLSWPFTPCVNLTYGEESLKSNQSLHYEATLSYSGRVVVRTPTSMTLAVKCNRETASHFVDLGYPDQPCITADKLNEMQERLEKEVELKARLAHILMERMVLGEITEAEYKRKIALLEGLSGEDGFVVTGKDALLHAAGEPSFEGAHVRLGLGVREILALLDAPGREPHAPGEPALATAGVAGEEGSWHG